MELLLVDKEQALQLWRASGRSAAKVAAELGIRPPLLYHRARTERLPSALRHLRRSAHRHLQLHRGLLQPHQTAFQSCLPQPNQL